MSNNVTYSQNNYNNDPQNTLSSARQNGGRIKMKGGSGLLGYLSSSINDLIVGNSTNPVINFGTSTGSVFTQNLLNNNPILSNNTNNSPATSMYSNGGNRPLV